MRTAPTPAINPSTTMLRSAPEGIRVPTTVIDISDVIQKKSAAMNRFTSQHFGEDGALERKRAQGADGGINATMSRVSYAEAFVAHNPETYDYFPVSEYRRKLATRSPEELFEQMTWMHLD